MAVSDFGFRNKAAASFAGTGLDCVVEVVDCSGKTEFTFELSLVLDELG